MLELNARELRTGIRSPGYLAKQMARELAQPTPSDTPRSPQRVMIDAALRRYFGAGRQPAALFDYYDEHVASAKRRESAATEFANGRRMLERFVRWDQDEADPLAIQLRPARVVLAGVAITMKADLIYGGLRGRFLRLLITDGEIARDEHLRLYATAAALHFERRTDGDQLTNVELWRLKREDGRSGWPRSVLVTTWPSLRRRLLEMRFAGLDQAA